MTRQNVVRILGMVVLVVATAAAAVTVALSRPPTVEQLAKEGWSMRDTPYWNDAATRELWDRHAKMLGKPAPALELTDRHGKPVAAANMKGKIVVVDFWATWCGPCLAAVPHTNEIAKKYADRGVVVVGACGGGEEEDMAKVAKDAGMQYPTAKASAATTKAWDVQFWPHYAVIDRDGALRATGIKGDYLERVLQALLDEGGPTTMPK